MRYLAALAGAILLATPASAATIICLSPQQMASVLETEHGERPVMEGSDFAKNPAVLYMSPTGTWTLVVFPREASACVMAVGKPLSLPGTPS